MVCASCTNTKNSTVPDNFVLKEDVYTIKRLTLPTEDVYTIKRLTLPKEFCLFVRSLNFSTT
jgi:hypothetical protein